MTRFLILLITGVWSNAHFAQDTLVEQNTVMYSCYYVLHEDNRFELHTVDCGGLAYGQGHIEKSPKEWVFVYHELPELHTTYSCSNARQSDSVEFEFREIADSSFCEVIDVLIHQKSFVVFDGKLTLPKNQLPYDCIQIVANGDSLIIHENVDEFTKVTFYVKDQTVTYVEGVEEVLNKRGRTFYQKFDVLLFDEEKKEFRRKKIRYVYKLK